jgi:hypothetical protein
LRLNRRKSSAVLEEAGPADAVAAAAAPRGSAISLNQPLSKELLGADVAEQTMDPVVDDVDATAAEGLFFLCFSHSVTFGD